MAKLTGPNVKRCTNCNHPLGKINLVIGKIEIECRKCGVNNIIEAKPEINKEPLAETFVIRRLPETNK